MLPSPRPSLCFEQFASLSFLYSNFKKPSLMEHPSIVDHLEQGLIKANYGHFELGLDQPRACAYPYMDQCYGVSSTYGPRFLGRVMLPLNLLTEDGPIYVNAKQYNGIIRRRQSRAKAVLVNKVTKAPKPYMHHSRHLHAKRRPRGCDGRFLNKESSNSDKEGMDMNKAVEGKVSHPTAGRRASNLSKEADGVGSLVSRSEMMSMYSRGDLDHFSINHLGLSVHSFPVMMENGRHGTVMPSKWVATADNCCNIKV